MGSYWSTPVPNVEIKVEKDKEDESVIAVSFCLGFQGISTPSVEMDFHNPGKAFGVDYEHLETFITNLENPESSQGLVDEFTNGSIGISMTKDELVFSIGANLDGALTTHLPRQEFGPLMVAELRKFIDGQKQK